MKTVVKIQKGCVLGGAMPAEKATGNSLITFGTFTQEAKNFVEIWGSNLRLTFTKYYQKSNVDLTLTDPYTQNYYEKIQVPDIA